MKDGQPLEISNYLAFHFMPKLYAHHMDYAMTLLQNEDVTKFNSLRDTTHFLTFNLSQRDFSGLDLRFANLAAARAHGGGLLEYRARGRRFPARRNASRESEQRRGHANRVQRGDPLERDPDRDSRRRDYLREGSPGRRLVDPSRRTCDSPISRAPNSPRPTSFDSRFFDASFDGADFTLASAVGSDFAVVKSMNDVNLTGANLTGARIEPDRVERAWFVNVDGLSSRTARDLRRHGGIARPEEVLEKVDSAHHRRFPGTDRRGRFDPARKIARRCFWTCCRSTTSID